MKEIEKYVGYYLLVYLAVLSVCGFFQYIAICQGKSLECAFSMDGINTIITTTSYVLTPIIAIIGFLSWRSQETYRKSQEFIEQIMNKMRELEITWHQSREYGDISRFQEYCMKDVLGTTNFDNLDLSKKEVKKIEKNIMLLGELIFLIDKLHLTSRIDVSNLNKAVSKVDNILHQDLADLFDFQQQLVLLKYGDKHILKSENEMRELCDKFDRYCNQIMGGRSNTIRKENYSMRIKDNMKEIIKEVVKFKLEI